MPAGTRLGTAGIDPLNPVDFLKLVNKNVPMTLISPAT